MKVKIKMFTGAWEMKSETIYLPDQTRSEIRLSLPSPVTTLATWPPNEKDTTFQEIKCEFVWCGQYEDGVRVYVLNRICGAKGFHV